MGTTVLYARSQAAKGNYSEAVNTILLQYAKSPHYGSALLYQYGKYAVMSQSNDKLLLESAIGALEEVQRCSVNKRKVNSMFYIAQAY